MTIHTTPTTTGRCDFCARPACSCSQQVDDDDRPLRVSVLACWRHEMHGRCLAETTPVVVVVEVVAGLVPPIT